MKRATVALVAFALGTGFGFWLAPVSTPAPRRAATSRTPPAPAPEPGRGAPRDMEELPPPPAGDATIRGRVLDELGQPIPEALVVAVPRSPDFGKRPRRAGEVPWQDFTLRRSVATLRWYERYRRTTRTGPDGRYELTELGAVPHRIQAYREGYKVKRGPDVPKGDVTPDATVDFTGERFVLLGVEIVMPDGRPAEKAWLQLRGPESSRGSGWSTASPWVEVRPGTYEIEAVAGARREYTSAKHTVRVDADVEPEPIRLQLEAERGLRVRVKLAEGLTARRFCVECVRFTGPEPPGLWALRTSDHIRRAPGTASASSRERELWLADLEPGRYLVGVPSQARSFGFGRKNELGCTPWTRTKGCPCPDTVGARVLRYRSTAMYQVDDKDRVERLRTFPPCCTGAPEPCVAASEHEVALA
jgi:hypothetical protein